MLSIDGGSGHSTFHNHCGLHELGAFEGEHGESCEIGSAMGGRKDAHNVEVSLEVTFTKNFLLRVKDGATFTDELHLHATPSEMGYR